MGMINGVLTMVKSFNEAVMLGRTENLVYVGEQEISSPLSIIKAAILLPPVDAVMCEADGDMNSYTNMYMNHLCNNPVASATITTILISLHYGKNICIVVEAPELSHFGFLHNFFVNMYGIVAQTMQNPPQMIPTPLTEARIAAEMYCYMDGYISPYEMAGVIIDSTVYGFLVDMEIQNGMKAISKLAFETGFLREPILLLEFNTFYNFLVNFKFECEHYAKIVQNQKPAPMIKILGE